MSIRHISIDKGCPLLDYQISVDTDGMLYPCCNIPNIKFSNLADLRNWQAKQKKVFSKNQWPSACSICKSRENNTGYSQRLHSHLIYDYDLITATPIIKDLQVAYKNLCNLSCIICDVKGSSSIYDYVTNNNDVPVNWQWNKQKHLKWNEEHLDFILEAAPSLWTITFLGGEPFLIKEYISILDKLPDLCVVLIVTNGTTYNRDFINRLKKFKTLSIMFSIDGYGIVNEALRLNSKWPIIEKNVLKIKKELPNATIGLCPTWTNFNIFHWKSLYDWAIQNNLYYPIGFWQNVITYPEHLKLCYIPEHWKEYILKNCNDNDILQKLESWFNEPQTDDVSEIQIQWNLLKQIANTKNFDYEKLFPHIYQDFKSQT